MQAALDTSYILGCGAVKDTYNLLADGIVQVARALSVLDGIKIQGWASKRGLERYFGPSVKGEAAINWDDEKERRTFLQAIVADADRVLELARQAQWQLPNEDQKRQVILDSADLLGQLLLQDVERKDDGVSIKEGVSRNRIPSVRDPEMRHGHNSSSVRFDGYKAAVAVDTDSQLITAVDVLPGNAPDNTGAMRWLNRGKNTACEVEETMGDCAYGDGATCQTFVNAVVLWRRRYRVARTKPISLKKISRLISSRVSGPVPRDSRPGYAVC